MRRERKLSTVLFFWLLDMYVNNGFALYRALKLQNETSHDISCEEFKREVMERLVAPSMSMRTHVS